MSICPLATKLQNPFLPRAIVILCVLIQLLAVLQILLWPQQIWFDHAKKAKACLHEQTRDSFITNHVITQMLWDKLSRFIDKCSYSPHLFVERYHSLSGITIFHIPNRNQFLSRESCSIVSVNNAFHSDAEQILANSSSCDFYASDKTIITPATYHTGTASLEVLLNPRREKKKMTTDLRSLVTANFGVRNIDNLIIGPFEHNIEFRNILTPEFYDTFGSRICQETKNRGTDLRQFNEEAFVKCKEEVLKIKIGGIRFKINIIYMHVNVVSRYPFLRSFQKILNQQTFLIVKTSKSYDNRYMNVYAINYQDEYCVERYLKPTLEYKVKI